jgi:hypothetical protein
MRRANTITWTTRTHVRVHYRLFFTGYGDPVVSRPIEEEERERERALLP